MLSKMSSDDGQASSPVLPRDSDRGSSVSSDLQDEYEELLRYAVVTPKFEHHHGVTSNIPLLSASHDMSTEDRSSQGNYANSQRPSASVPEAEDGRHSSRSAQLSQGSPLIAESHSKSRTPREEETAGRLSGRASTTSDTPSERLQTISERSRQSSPDPTLTELFISDHSISKMENILDTWSVNLKSSVVMELRKWKWAFIEEHRQELRKERERHAASTAGLNAELASLKELLQTYATSNQRKDEVIVNLSKTLDRQKQKLEKMRAFTNWRLKHSEAREEAYAGGLAQQHYNLQLKRKVWLGWHALIQRHWKDKVERACRARAEDVCVRMSEEYEAKMAEHCKAVEKAQAEIQKMQVDRDRYEESMKKAFMRGVCALNIEALSMFHNTEGRAEQSAVHEQHDDAPPPQNEPVPSSLGPLQPGPGPSTRFSPVHSESPGPTSHGQPGDTRGTSASVSRAEALSSTTVVHSSLPLGGTANTHRSVSGRVVTASQQKPSKTVTARITARPADPGRTARGNLQVMGVCPPMSSVIVERHHPVTQLTIGQAMASKFPHSAQQSHGPSGGKRSSKTHNACHIHSIKVVD